jgi:hypothetical protein
MLKKLQKGKGCGSWTWKCDQPNRYGEEMDCNNREAIAHLQIYPLIMYIPCFFMQNG